MNAAARIDKFVAYINEAAVEKFEPTLLLWRGEDFLETTTLELPGFIKACLLPNDAQEVAVDLTKAYAARMGADAICVVMEGFYLRPRDPQSKPTRAIMAAHQTTAGEVLVRSYDIKRAKPSRAIRLQDHSTLEAKDWVFARIFPQP